MSGYSRARDEADRLLRLIVSQRGACDRCGGAGSQVAHIVRRRYNAVRCDERNVWWLCAGPGSNDCHATVDQFEGEHDLLMFQTIGEGVLTELRIKAHNGPPDPLSVFWPAEVARLRERCSALGLNYRRSA